MFGAVYNKDIASPSYSTWAAKATNTAVSGSCDGGPGSGSPPVVVTSVVALPPRPTVSVGPIVPACARSYRVVAGDYCYKIATENGLTLDQLFQMNPGLNCEPLQIGVVVCLRR